MSKILSFIRRLKKASPKKLEFGCGPSLTPGFEGCDIRWFKGVNYICNAWEIDLYVKNAVVDEIYSRHFLEHLTFSQVDLTLRSWGRILKSDGLLRIMVPDINYHIQQFLSSPSDTPSAANPAWTLHEHAIAGFWGWQREGESKQWDVHKSGYNFEMLRSRLEKHGYIGIERLHEKPWNLYIQARKK